MTPTDHEIKAALHHLGRLTIVFTALGNGHTSIYDQHTRTLYVDPSCDILATLRRRVADQAPSCRARPCSAYR